MSEDAAPPDLPPSAHAAWTAFVAMRDAKTQHFDYLRQLADGEQRGERRSLAESAYLEKLLAEHTVAVRFFRDAILALAKHDTVARDTLLQLLAQAEPETPIVKSGSVH